MRVTVSFSVQTFTDFYWSPSIGNEKAVELSQRYQFICWTCLELTIKRYKGVLYIIVYKHYSDYSDNFRDL